MSTASDFFSWSQNRYAWVTNNPTDVSDVTSSDVAQYEGDVSRLTGETKRPEEPLPWQNYFSSLYENNVLWAGGRGAMVVKMTADRNFYRRHRIAQEGSALANIDLRIIACAMGDMNWFVLSGYVCIFGVFLAYFWRIFGVILDGFICGFFVVLFFFVHFLSGSSHSSGHITASKQDHVLLLAVLVLLKCAGSLGFPGTSSFSSSHLLFLTLLSSFPPTTPLSPRPSDTRLLPTMRTCKSSGMFVCIDLKMVVSGK